MYKLNYIRILINYIISEIENKKIVIYYYYLIYLILNKMMYDFINKLFL